MGGSRQEGREMRSEKTKGQARQTCRAAEHALDQARPFHVSSRPIQERGGGTSSVSLLTPHRALNASIAAFAAREGERPLGRGSSLPVRSPDGTS